MAWNTAYPKLKQHALPTCSSGSFLSSCPSGHLGGGPQSLVASAPRSRESCSPGAAAGAEDSLLLHSPAQWECTHYRLWGTSRAASDLGDIPGSPWGFPGGASGQEASYQCRRHKRPWFDPGSGRSSGGGHGNPLQYFLENPMDRGSWRAIVHGITKSRTQLKWLSTHAHRLPVVSEDRRIPLVRGTPLADSCPAPPGDALWLNSWFILPTRTGPLEILD